MEVQQEDVMVAAPTAVVATTRELAGRKTAVEPGREIYETSLPSLAPARVAEEQLLGLKESFARHR